MKALPFAIACVLGLASFGCHRADAPNPAPPIATPAPSASQARATNTNNLVVNEPLSKASYYELAVKLENQHGKPAAFDQGRGHPTIVAMFYATCPHACPLMISKIRKIEDSLSPAARSDLRVVLVSFAPDTDDAEMFQKVIARHNIDDARWTLGRSAENDVREVAAVLGIKYRKLDDGNFNHTSPIVVLDREGRPLVRIDGPEGDGAPVAAAVEQVAARR